MKRLAIVLSLVFLVAPAVFAADDPVPPEMNPANFCEGRYALCIKAPCEPIVTRDAKGNYSIKEANCNCVIEAGWSMGPGECDARRPKTVNGRTYLISTYSNFFNTTDLTLTCPNDDTVWAWCYGSPCVEDEKDSKKAICTCPIKVSKSKTLGGECRQIACKSIWSAATFAEDKFANDHYYEYMKQHHPVPPPNKPAKDCPTPPKK
jgi:hypothetical protein